VDPVPDPLLFSGSAGNKISTSISLTICILNEMLPE
jgi:hypothetical protein